MMKPATTMQIEIKEAEHTGISAPTDMPSHGITATSDRREEAMGKDLEGLPKGYFCSIRFVGSYCVRVPSFLTLSEPC